MGRVLLTTRYNFLEFFMGFHHFPQLINPVRVLSDPSLGVIHIFESCTKTYNNTYLHKINLTQGQVFGTKNQEGRDDLKANFKEVF